MLYEFCLQTAADKAEVNAAQESSRDSVANLSGTSTSPVRPGGGSRSQRGSKQKSRAEVRDFLSIPFLTWFVT